MFSAFAVHTIRTHIFGNFIVNHFALNNSVEDAKKILSKMAVIVDFEALPEESTKLLNCILGWSVHLKHSNSNDKQIHNVDEISSKDIYEKLKWYRRLDYEVYEHGLDLIRNQYHQSSLYSNSKSDPPAKNR